MSRNPLAKMLRAERPRFARRRGSTRSPGESESLLATLEEARADLMDAIEISSDAYALFDSDDRLVRCNNSYRKYFLHDDAVVIPGMTFESILRRSAVKRFAPEQLAEWEQWIQRRLQSHREPEGTFKHQLPDGRWLKTTDYKTARGTVFTVHADITQEKCLMWAAEEREQRLHAMFDTNMALVLLRRRAGPAPIGIFTMPLWVPAMGTVSRLALLASDFVN